MRKWGWLLLTILSPMATARTLYVGAAEPIRTIRQGLAQAAPGDTIIIRAGTYKEHSLAVDKPLTLIGENYPIIDGELKGEILTITADNVVVRGLQLQRVGITSTIDWAAVKVLEAQHVQVLDNRIEHAYFGVYLSASAHCQVLRNQISGAKQSELTSGNGVHAWKCHDLYVAENTVSLMRDGIYFEFVNNSLIAKNNSTRNIRYGLHFMFSDHNRYEYNTFRDNGAGVAVMYTRNVTMRHNTFVQNWGDAAYGLLLKEISDSRISYNVFQTNTIGLQMEGSNRIQVENNRFAANGWGIRVQASCSDNVFTKNDFLSNTFDVATNGTLVLNTFNQNYWDKYEGYDLNHDRIGDVPFHPVSLFAMIIEQMPYGVILLRSFMVSLLDRAEKMMPSLTPEALADRQPMMNAFP